LEKACVELLLCAEEGFHQLAKKLLQQWGIKLILPFFFCCFDFLKFSFLSFSLLNRASTAYHNVRGGPALYRAVEAGHWKVVDVLLSFGENPNSFSCDAPERPLASAIEKEDEEMVKVFLKHNAKVTNTIRNLSMNDKIASLIAQVPTKKPARSEINKTAKRNKAK
jgi:ankyrin repeat protein